MGKGVGFEGFSEDTRDIPGDSNPTKGWDGNDESNLEPPSTKGGGPNEASDPSTNEPDADDE